MSSPKGRKAFNIETSQAIGERIRSARGDRTQEEFASRIGVSRSALTNYEAGRRLPNDLVLSRIAEETGVSVNSILFGETKIPFEMYFKSVQNAMAIEASKRPGFIPKFMVSDDEYALICLFRLMIMDGDGWSLVDELIRFSERYLSDERALETTPPVQFGEGHLERLKEARKRGVFDQGYDPHFSFWVTFWEEAHERASSEAR